jgi:hypothetical protein
LWLAPDLPAASQLSTSLKAKKDGKNARVALIEVSKKGECLGLHDGIDLNSEKDWMKEVKLVARTSLISNAAQSGDKSCQRWLVC